MALVDLRMQAQRRSTVEMVAHLHAFTLAPKISAGIWYFTPPDSRFHSRYADAMAIEARLEVAARLASDGLAGIEAHYPNEINEDNAELWRSFSRDTGIRILTIIPLLFRAKEFEWGSLSNPDPHIRDEAIALTRRALEMNREFDTDFAVVWPGIDGYELSFGVDMVAMRDRFVDGLAAAMDAVPGIRIAFEPKPYEPRGHILFGTTPEGVLLCRMVEARLREPANRALLDAGHALACMNPEIGHVLMGYEDLPTAYSWPLAEARLAHMHVNSQPLGNYDQDLNIGAVSPEQFEALCYALKMYGYAGYMGIDINPERMPVETAIRINIDAIRAACDRVNELDHASIMHATSHPDITRGWLEAYLVRARAARPDRLPPLAPLV